MCCNNSSDENQRRLASGSTIRLPCGTICTLSIDRSSAKTHHVVGSMLMRPQARGSRGSRWTLSCGALVIPSNFGKHTMTLASLAAALSAEPAGLRLARAMPALARRGKASAAAITRNQTTGIHPRLTRPLNPPRRGQGPMPGPGIPRPPPSVPDFPPGTPKPPPRTVPDTPPGVPTPPDVAPPDPGVPDPPPAVPGVPEPPPTAPPISPPHVREEMPAVPPLAEQYRRIAQGLTAGAGAGEVDGPDESDPTREPPKAQGPGQEEPGKQKERTVGHEEPGQEGRAVAPEDEVGEALVERAACVADAMAAAEGSSLSSTEASTETEAVPGWMRAMEVRQWCMHDDDDPCQAHQRRTHACPCCTYATLPSANSGPRGGGGPRGHGRVGGPAGL